METSPCTTCGHNFIGDVCDECHPQRLAHNCGRIASHSGWQRGKWATDTCACGHKFGVPAGSLGKYQCNCCADRAEGNGY